VSAVSSVVAARHGTLLAYAGVELTARPEDTLVKDSHVVGGT
jgi:hypothetical protein